MFDPYFSPDGEKIVFSAYYKIGQDIYTMDVPKEFTSDLIAQQMTNKIEIMNSIPKSAFDLNAAKNETYNGFTLTPDILTGGFLYNSFAGFGGFAYLSFSDILGDHNFNIEAEYLSGFGEFNFLLQYYYLKNRINLGASIFHDKEYYYYFAQADNNQYDYSLFYLNKYGIDLLASYPFSKFFKFNFDILSMKYILQSVGPILNNAFFTNINATMNVLSASFVYDTSLWGMTSPVWGFYGNLTLQKSVVINQSDLLYNLAFIDLRKYFFMFKTYTFALRAEAGTVWGRDQELNKFYIGGYDTIRGYPDYSFSGSKMFLFNMEYRFPLVNVIQIAWPFTFN